MIPFLFLEKKDYFDPSVNSLSQNLRRMCPLRRNGSRKIRERIKWKERISEFVKPSRCRKQRN